MEKDNRKKIQNIILEYGLLLLTGIIFYFFLGKRWISIEDDSPFYLGDAGHEGVMPIYPAFLRLMRVILGEAYYLDGAVIVQSLLAVACTMLFVAALKRRFGLKLWEELLLYVACMLPFSIYLPESGITHQIMTEGISYALFYLFFAAIAEAVWTTKYRWYLASMLMAFILGLTRSQMLFLQAICLLILLWVTYKKFVGTIWRKIGICLTAFAIGLLLSFGTYKATYAVVRFDAHHQSLWKVSESKAGEEENGVNADENEDIARQSDDADANANSAGVSSTNSQFVTIIMSRGFYEADQQDVDLFQDEMMREIFTRTYELADSEGKLYNYATPGLYMWEDLVYDRMLGFALQAIEEYDTHHPGERVRDIGSISRELGLRVLTRHFGRYIYHTIRLMIPSFIASVFFQVRPIYLLCHFITLFLYLFSVAGCVCVYRSMRNRICAELMAVVLCTLIIMVVSVNLLFIGLQRYMVYGMGIFYCALYLLCKEILTVIRQKRRVK